MVSSKTGWAYNDIKNGGYEYLSGYNQPTGPGLVFIEGGTFTLGRVVDDVRYDWNNIPRRITVSSFYMDETEVTNADYREYLQWLKRVYSDYPKLYQQALPDTLVWRGALAFNEPMTEHYLRHPSYNDYPVVGVTWIQANQYCDWRTDRVNEDMLIKEGFLSEDPNQSGANNFNTDAYLAGQYKGVAARIEDGLFFPKYRLPTEAEWEFAALGFLAKDELVENKRIFPWRSKFTRYEEKTKMGYFMANFVRGRGDYMGISAPLNDAYPFTSPVKSYLPNDYGLYDMAGNVNEWVLDVYRPLSSVDFDEINPYRGNVFTVPQRDPEGNKSTGQMYFQGSGDKKLGITSRISDKARVYKGGSWRDRVYWIVPGTRRYLDEDKSTDDIGFRCAMSRLGKADGK